MLVGYARVSKADGSQSLDLQVDALAEAGVAPTAVYSDRASGKADARPGLDACLKALRGGDTLVVWKLDRLGRNLRHLVNTVHELTEAGIGLKVLTGQGAAIDTTTPAGQLVFAIFAARARGRTGGRPYTMTPAKIRLAAAAMSQRDTSASALCAELGISRQTLYRYVSPTGQLRPDAVTLLARAKTSR